MPSSFNQPDIPTISKMAPPSYAEAMAQIATKNSSCAAPYGQPLSTTTSMYDQSCSQMPGYPSSAPANNFYSNISNQPAYNPSYVPMESSRRTTTPAIVRIEPIRSPEKLCCDGCATWNKRVAIILVFTILIIYLIKVIVSVYL
ncbi:uncharacterized protein LOC116850056 [Odontomachus brunneus]|uniref:uncharacterized protein LOC116850056 n=1 Tax=Odontomachus brunneus TaxID=486640 RepID=UPI0013F1E423|nr:uncharacterized protein LOC116850056 [Odontomachus brunneus]XP_032683756.1 uncharacterized protein LOC116850056 [Odontomachus brunneus]